MSLYQRRQAALAILFLIVGSTKPANCALAATYGPDLVTGEVVVPLPNLMQKTYCSPAHNTPEQDEERPSGSRLRLPLQLRRARNLLAAGHYKEAIADYTEGLPKWDVAQFFRQPAEYEFAIACERVGRIDDAIRHAKLSASNALIARLLLQEGRFEEAREIADNSVRDSRISYSKYHSAQELGPWLQFRALVEYRLRRYESAVRDLKEAAVIYYRDDSEGAESCVRAANLLMERFKLGAPFELNASQLPAEGKDRVVELVNFFSTSKKPLSIAQLNRIVGARIKLPGETWRNVYQKVGDINPFCSLEYRSDESKLQTGESVSLGIAVDQCCVPQSEVCSLLTANGGRILSACEFEVPQYWEGWKLPSGQLLLRFGRGGARVLKDIRFVTFRPEKELSLDQLKMRALGCWNNDEKKVSILTKAIERDDKMVSLFVDRAIAYCAIGRFAEALVDARRAVTLGGRSYLDQLSLVEEKMGNLEGAIEHLKEFIGERIPGPETVELYTRLTGLYVKNKQYREALGACERALVSPKDIAGALFFRAQAEAGLGNFDKAHADAKAASDLYFSEAKIVLRDQVLKWSRTLP